MRIRQYKNFIITYNKKDRHFHAKKGKRELEPTLTEDTIIAKIDQLQEEEDREKRDEEHNKTIKMLEDAHFIVDAREFKYFCKCIKSFANEVDVTFEGDRFECTTFDPANVLIVSMAVDAECNKDIKHFKFALNIDKLHGMMVGVIGGDKLNITFDLDDNFMSIGDGFGEYMFKIVEHGGDQCKVPELTFNNAFEMKSTKFKFYMKCCGKIGESVAFEVENHKMRFVCEGDLEKYTSPEIDQNGDDTKAKYSIEYLEKLGFNGLLFFEFSKDYPLKVTDEDGNFMILAPRVEND